MILPLVVYTMKREMMKMKTDGVLFDLDGTLWDATAGITEVWNDILRREEPGMPPFTRQQIQSCMGLLLPDIGRRLFPHAQPGRQQELVDAFCRQEQALLRRTGGTLYRGMEETLQRLHSDFPLFIVSNCQDGYIECFFEAHAMSTLFRDTECSGRTGLPKAQNITLLAQRNGLKAPVYVGDTALDGKSAREAGVPFIHARYGFGTADAADAVIDSITELPGLLEPLKQSI